MHKQSRIYIHNIQSNFFSIGVMYGGQAGPNHGGNGGTPYFFSIPSGQYINRVEGRSGARIDQLKFITNTGAVYGPLGETSKLLGANAHLLAKKRDWDLVICTSGSGPCLL